MRLGWIAKHQNCHLGQANAASAEPGTRARMSARAKISTDEVGR
jgi:hypothetical protein